MSDSKPDLIFFRAHPAGWIERPPLPAAMQAFEMSLLSIALGQCHTALVLSVSALEATLKAHLGLPLPTEEKPRVPNRYLIDLWEEVAREKTGIASFPKERVQKLAHKRNRMAHYGHAPSDNPGCAELLIDVSYPLLTTILADCFDFHLDWRALRPEAPDISALSEDESSKCGLIPYVARHWRGVFDVRRNDPTVPAEDCLIGLRHYVRRYIQPTFTSGVEDAVLEKSGQQGFDYDLRSKRLSRLNSQFPHYWVSDCPYCNEIQCLALDLIFPDTGHDIGVRRAMCANCDLWLPESGRLASVLLAEEVAEDLPRIVKEYHVDE